MKKWKAFCSNKCYGFFVSIFVFLFSIVTAVVYAVSYSGSGEMSRQVVYVIVVGVLVSVILGMFKQFNWIPVALALGNFVALLLFIKSIYFYVSVVLYGINGSAFSPAFLSSSVFLLLAVVFSVANIFMKQVKAD